MYILVNIIYITELAKTSRMVHGNYRRRWKCYKHKENHTQTTIPKITPPKSKLPETKVKKKFDVLNLESVVRIKQIPLVESGWYYAENFYHKIKQTNGIIGWTLNRAENSIQNVVATALPAIALLETPISTIDKIVCKSLDYVETKVPSINLPPKLIYWNTKQYVTDVSTKLVRPVLKRANSVKIIGNTVLTSKYTAFAADTLDGALCVADKYVEKYLPGHIYDDQRIEEDNNIALDGPTSKAMRTMHHMGRFSGKLQRRLTKRTLAEAKALKEQSTEAIHVLIYVAELIATDPKLAFEKGKQLWFSLSKDEPENQARPENLEQLMVLLIRESARRFVHLVNFVSNILSKIPKNFQKTSKVLSYSMGGLVNTFVQASDAFVKSAHLENLQKSIITTVKQSAQNFAILFKQVNMYVIEILDGISPPLNAPEQSQSAALEVPKVKVQLRAAHANRDSNGLEPNK